MSDVLKVDIKGYLAELPILPLPSGIKIAFFNLHGNTLMTEHCGKELAKFLTDCDILITAESKGLQLTHVVARELSQPYYAVARKSKKLYMQDGIDVLIESSITTGKEQRLYLSKHDVELIKGKKVAIVDDVVSTGGTFKAMEVLLEKIGDIEIAGYAAVLREGTDFPNDKLYYLNELPIFVG